MIRVVHPPEPDIFEARVGKPGRQFLSACPHPSRDDWAIHRYWSAVHPYLHTQLRGVCGYCSSFTPFAGRNAGVNQSSIDHFIPKNKGDHQQAYRWANLRLARARLNNRKGEWEDVLDPCGVSARWFRLDFSTFFIQPDPELAEPAKSRVVATIKRLQLNEDDDYVNERLRVVYSYVAGRMPWSDVLLRYPFIASEMQAQNFDTALLPKLRTLMSQPRFAVTLSSQPWL